MDNKIHETAKRALNEDDDALSDDELLAELENDPELEQLREARLDQLKREIDHVRSMRARGHGEYSELQNEEGMVSLVGKERRAVAHFAHPQFARCKILDNHLRTLAPYHFETRFATINAEKCPFLVKKFQVRMLPCLLLIVNGRVVDRLVGFEEFGNNDKFTTETLERRLAKSGAIQLPKGELAGIPVAQRPVSYQLRNESNGKSGNDNGDDIDMDY
ncbi:hypothetical protein GGI25_000484 [Coemansia spiralis]|uniref:Thioredoxin domain-containing protein n=2 Tax=Coemansia TaxID=4863 RepID=A0A9W8L166_9FUNG|nr:thioredoxin-like protein [Coemansia spiralis]KAJ1996421.1 hypothetical protein EDC05_000312 [Coemansia umbellata]KAJ2624115.1 hypothetical protein GGI26_001690 [Coemansia sp. RSA 1358]KAJ2680848.1 hypothetical protein GGI25_000484 [Coemansia spiralis]